jgi:hypothetical protein
MSKSKKKEKPLYDQNGNWADQKRMVIGAIRRLFRQSPQFKEVHEASRVEVPRYNKDGTLSKKPYVKRTCEVCGELFSSTNIAIDHIEPMVPLHLTDNDLSYNEIVENIICKKPNLQRICNPKKGKKNKPKFLEFCHQKKTHLENFLRKQWQEHFEKKGIVAREGKDAEFHFFGKQLEEGWKELYKEELKMKYKEIEEKEEKRRLREEKKLLKLSKNKK